MPAAGSTNHRRGDAGAWRRGRTGLAVGAAVALSTGVVAGCTSSGSGSAGATTSTSTTAGAGATAPGGGSAGSSPTTIVNQPAARKAVTLTSCKQTSSGWTAHGSVADPNSKQTTYTIVVSFTTKASTVLARGTTTVVVKGGATKSWSASANFAKTKGVVCVLRGVAAS